MPQEEQSIVRDVSKLHPSSSVDALSQRDNQVETLLKVMLHDVPYQMGDNN